MIRLLVSARSNVISGIILIFTIIKLSSQGTIKSRKWVMADYIIMMADYIIIMADYIIILYNVK